MICSRECPTCSRHRTMYTSYGIQDNEKFFTSSSFGRFRGKISLPSELESFVNTLLKIGIVSILNLSPAEVGL